MAEWRLDTRAGAFAERSAGSTIVPGESRPDEALPMAESAAFTMLASQMLNLDEVLNK
jgi:hypothetical protein